MGQDIEQEQPEKFSTYAESVQRELKKGEDLETKRFRVAQQFPVSLQMAEIHYKSNWFGIRTSQEDRVCPCCLERIKQKQFGFLQVRMTNNFLSTDIILYFLFIKFLVAYMVLKLLITDGYNMHMNYKGQDCGVGKASSCKITFFSKLSTCNRISNDDSLFITDLLNLAFVILSIVFWTICERYTYKKYINISAQIQTEDDYTVFVENIPIVQDIKSGVINYKRSLKEYFNSIIINQLQNPTKDELYENYLKVSAKHGHSPNNPPRIVSNINLCWNLYELTAIHGLKDELQEKFEKNAKYFDEQNKEGYTLLDYEMAQELATLDKTEIELCQRFQMNEKFGFALSRFLGKAFISFEYHHFAMLINRLIRSSKHFLKDVSLKATPASFPRDVYWQNLNVTDQERRDRTVTTFLLTLGCLIFAFLAFLTIKYFEVKNHRSLQKSKFTNWIIRISTSILSVSVTMLLYWIIKQLSLFQEHETKTKYETSYLFKSISAIIFNQIINTCIGHWLLKIQIWSPEGLAQQIISTLIVWYIIQTLYYSVNLAWLLRWIKLKWKYRRLPILKFQNRYNRQYELPTFFLSSRYSSYLSDLYYLCFFGYIAPVSDIIGIISFATYYLIDRFNILRRCSYHPNYSYLLINRAFNFVQSSLVLVTFGNYLFSAILTGRKYNPVNLISIAISLVYLGVIWSDRFNISCFDDYVVYQENSFTDCKKQNRFFDTYFSLNPATKLSSQQRRNKVYLGVNAPTNSASSKPTAAHEEPSVVDTTGEQSKYKQTKG